MVLGSNARRFAAGVSGYAAELCLPAFAAAVLAIVASSQGPAVERALAGAAALAVLAHGVLSLTKAHLAAERAQLMKAAMTEAVEAIEGAGRTTLGVLETLNGEVVPSLTKTVSVAAAMTADRRLSASVRGRAAAICASSETTLAALRQIVEPGSSMAEMMEPAYVVTAPAQDADLFEDMAMSANDPAPDAAAYDAEPMFVETVPVLVAEDGCQSLEGMRVLVGEANGVHQLVLRTHLAQLGAEAEIFADGIEVMEAWREGNWDLVMLDVQMPRMDGLAAARMIRSVEGRFGWSPTPIVALAPNDSDAQMMQCAEAGMSAFVAKPIDGEALFAAIEAAFAAPLEAPQIEEAPMRMARVA